MSTWRVYEMWAIGLLLVLSVCPLQAAQPLSDDATEIIVPPAQQQYMEEVAEQTDEEWDWESEMQELDELQKEPINLNHTSYRELRKLPFLSDEQIEEILLYSNDFHFNTVYELRLIAEMDSLTIRYLLPYVTIGDSKTDEAQSLRKDISRHSHHEVYVRTDARNIEGFSGDPMYVKMRYKWMAGKHLTAGIGMERDAGEPWWGKHTYGFDHYGGFVQLSDIGIIDKAVVGDYRASFGLGLVISQQLPMGKQTACRNLGMLNRGLQRYAGTDEYNFLRGVGATLRLGPTELTAFYSYKRIDANVQKGAFPSIIRTGNHRTPTELGYKNAAWQQVIGVNATYHHERLHVGVTATMNLLSDTLKPTLNYYNQHYWRGRRQASVGINAQYIANRWSLYGEVATSENSHWGVACLIGGQWRANNDISLLALVRYYSPFYDNMLSSCFGEGSRGHDERGVYVSCNVQHWAKWHISGYADVFANKGMKYGVRAEHTWGIDGQIQTDYIPNKKLRMYLRLRHKEQAMRSSYMNGKTQARYQLQYEWGRWQMRADLLGAYYASSSVQAWGGAAMGSIQYQVRRIPMWIQGRVGIMDVRDWNARLYCYENDVLFAYSIPAIYGQGVRWYINLRYAITPQWCVYLRTSETIYGKDWADAHRKGTRTQTDIHLCARWHI